jgi:hypothetical protein
MTSSALGRLEDIMDNEAKPRRFSETIEVAGSQVIEQVKRLIKESNVRQLKVHAKDSDFALEMPVTVGVLVGGAVVLTAPWLAILGVIAALMTRVEIEVERDAPAEVPEPPKTEA